MKRKSTDTGSLDGFLFLHMYLANEMFKIAL